ncbi:ORF3 protein [NL63-related bat coronavirus]|uniref:ORF3 protein n=1 Tax=NL63-related bat coronavirus TaxID=1920748 RepID=A0A1L2KGB1_9ALPC|nr:ORF3 protein [NL63-related bat coronavirus]APD51476.1 ORF3 protein [NL63-related bat coronavirus]
MFGGLFQLSIEKAINQSATDLKLSEDNAAILRDNLKPASTASAITAYLLTSLFVAYFALFKPLSNRGRVLCFAAKLLVLFLYVPLLFYVGAYLDGAIICVALLSRFFHVGYYAYLYKNFSFLLFNSTVLCFAMGKCWYFDKKKFGKEFVAVYGGDHYLVYGGQTIAFASASELYMAIRGSLEKNLQLMRKVELYNGDAIYVFAEEPVVGIVNMSCDIQLYEDVPAVN